MAQVLKPEVRERIADSALRAFAERGFAGASMAQIAQGAGTATANVYRYFPDKDALFAAVVPQALADRHDELLDARVAALAGPRRDALRRAEELLAFWSANRLAVVVLLTRAEGTGFAGYPQAFVDRLADHVERRDDVRPDATTRELLRVVFDGTRRAIAAILLAHEDPAEIRRLIHGYWAYQVPGLRGLGDWLAADAAQASPSSRRP